MDAEIGAVFIVKVFGLGDRVCTGIGLAVGKDDQGRFAGQAFDQRSNVTQTVPHRSHLVEGRGNPARRGRESPLFKGGRLRHVLVGSKSGNRAVVAKLRCRLFQTLDCVN